MVHSTYKTDKSEFEEISPWYYNNFLKKTGVMLFFKDTKVKAQNMYPGAYISQFQKQNNPDF